MGVRLERPDDLAIQSSTGGFSRALPGRRLGPTANALQRCCKTDHTSHLAVYLSNLDGNGIELAWDRAPEDWTFLIDGNLTAETLRGHEKRLDMAALIAEVNEAPAEPEPAIARPRGRTAALPSGDPAMTTTIGRWATRKASQYLQQLCKHFGHKVEARFDERAGTIASPGTSVRLVATTTELLVAVEGATPETTVRYREVIDSHLKRFAFRDGFEAMDWADTEETLA